MCFEFMHFRFCDKNKEPDNKHHLLDAFLWNIIAVEKKTLFAVFYKENLFIFARLI